MSTLRNPVWIGFNGEPITGRMPTRLRVYGQPLSKAQMGEVAHAYGLFCTANNLALGQYQSRERKLSDGTRVRMVSINGVDTVQVWPTGGEETACETLFYGRPASADHVNGYTPPEASGTTTVWQEYNKKKAAPEVLKYIGTSELFGESTWFSSKIKLNVEGYSPVMPAVVSWRGRGYRYGAYGQSQPNYKPFIEGTRPQRVPSVFPGQAYGSSHDGAGSTDLWVNDTHFNAWASVFGAGLRKIENEGVFLYVVDTPTLFELKVYRMPIKLPLRKGNGGDLGPGELVATFNFDYFDAYQGPFFNESCTKMVMLAIVEIDGDDQTCVVECDIDAGTYQIVHAATDTTTTAHWTNTWTYSESPPVGGELDVFISAFSFSSESAVLSPTVRVFEYPIAVDYKGDQLVYVKTRLISESTDGTSGASTASATYTRSPRLFSSSMSAEHWISQRYEVEHSIDGMLYSKATSAENAHTNESMTISGNDYDATVSLDYRNVSTAWHEFSKVQSVGGDLRHDFLILAESLYDGAWNEESVDYSGAASYSVFSSPTNTNYSQAQYRVVAHGQESIITSSASTPVRYIMLHKNTVLYEGESKLFTVDHPIPAVSYGLDGTVDNGAVTTTFMVTRGPGAVELSPSTSVSPYVAPVSQPTFFPLQASGDLYNAIVAANGNNQPGACCAIAWSPAYPDDPRPEVGYVSFISPRLWNSAGTEVPRVEFTKWYIGGQWVDSPSYAPGEHETIVRPIFMGTQLK